MNEEYKFGEAIPAKDGKRWSDDPKVYAMIVENERLREALKIYGQHRNNCAVVLGGYQCTCGFNQQEQPR